MRLLLAIFLLAMLGACARSTVTRAPDRPPPQTSQAPRSGEVVVARGDTLYGIAFRHGMDWRELARLNSIREPYTIYPGQRLRVQAAAAPARPVATRPAPARGTQSPPATRPATPPPSQQGRPPATAPAQTAPPSRPATPATTPASPTAPAQTPAPAHAAAGSPRWTWPAQGQLIGRFVAGDPTRQGIDIAGSAGQQVLAAADGEVVYSGSGLVGYGELIIIKHSDVWLSAYGHNRKRLVSEGERVRSGQQIAEMGRSGASRDMLHFEIRRNGKPVDPLQLLPAR